MVINFNINFMKFIINHSLKKCKQITNEKLFIIEYKFAWKKWKILEKLRINDKL